MLNKVELTLHKKAAGQKWPALEGTTPLKSRENGTDSVAKPTIASPPSIALPKILPKKAPAYPTSSRSGPKNWDKLASELTNKSKTKPKKEDKDNGSSGSEGDDDYDSDYGGDATDNFFKKLFAQSDPDTRRAMEKSMYESKGTALSTNWAEVGKGRVEVVKGKDDD
jgi:suppressor of G2 allele of SKP1